MPLIKCVSCHCEFFPVKEWTLRGEDQIKRKLCAPCYELETDKVWGEE